MNRWYYKNSIDSFLGEVDDSILGKLAGASDFDLTHSQKRAWQEQINILKSQITGFKGAILLEYSIPRLGERIDAVLIVDNVIFVLEFKVFEVSFARHAIDQVYVYGLDLKNFHKPSHRACIAPLLVATDAQVQPIVARRAEFDDNLIEPICCSAGQLKSVFGTVLKETKSPMIDATEWCEGSYSPTPTIVEAAKALYRGHSVSEIARSEAGQNLTATSGCIAQIIDECRLHRKKAVCFVTGVPGSGKTLVGLNVAHEHTDQASELFSVFLSGNGPLVDVLREALTRDKVSSSIANQVRLTKKQAGSQVKQFIQNVHHFRDDCLADPKPPVERVALFDEAQRAWDLNQTVAFMKRKKGKDFDRSEPSFLISCLDRHSDWAVVVCLVGGGQEINTGEGGIRGWMDAIASDFPEWRVFVSPELRGQEFDPGPRLGDLDRAGLVTFKPELHLSVSVRSFRAERLSNLVQSLLDIDPEVASALWAEARDRYHIRLTRDVGAAKEWLRARARGTERYGLVVSSAAERLRPQAIHVKAPINHVRWFLDSRDDVRSSFFLEDVATEFHVQGLELDWTGVVWDADFRYMNGRWQQWNFRGTSWQQVRQEDRKRFQKNAYRVLLTRARQGMVIVVPEGDPSDPTRKPEFYDGTYNYLRSIGFPTL